MAYFGVFTALALIFSYVETLIPFNFGIPGVKLGLANLIIVIALYKMNLREAYLLSVVRVVLAGFIFGNYFSIIYSLAGGILSLKMCIRDRCHLHHIYVPKLPQEISCLW